MIWPNQPAPPRIQAGTRLGNKSDAERAAIGAAQTGNKYLHCRSGGVKTNQGFAFSASHKRVKIAVRTSLKVLYAVFGAAREHARIGRKETGGKLGDIAAG